jgi:hypothetical protein
MCEGVIKHMKSMKLEALEEEDTFKLEIILHDFHLLFLEFAIASPKAIIDYFDFKKVFIVKLLLTQSEEHRLMGQDMLHNLIETICNIRPAVKAYEVQEAGFDFVNGIYELGATKCDSEGFIIPGIDVSYERVDRVFDKKLLLFLDKSFEDEAAIWCLSEEHDEDPAEPEYTDYYTAVGSLKGPPSEGWEVSDENAHPSPILEPLDDEVPLREEHSSFQDDLAKWLIEKKIPDLILGSAVCSSSNHPNQSTTTKICQALDAYTEGSNMMSAKMANLFVSILPSFQLSGCGSPASATTLSPVQNGSTNNGANKAVIEAAKARLASAERWAETTSKSLKSAQNALMNAKTEHESAKKEADEARAYLASIDSSAESNDAYNSDRRRSTGQISTNRISNTIPTRRSSGNTVGFDGDTSTITFDGERPSRFVKDDDDGSSSNDYDSSSLASSEEVVLKTSSKDVVLKTKSFPFM